MLTRPNYDEWIRGGVFALAMGLPLLLGHQLKMEQFAFVALGAMFALRLDPRRRPQRQALAIVGGMSLMILAGMLGVLLVGHKELAMAALVIIGFLAGQPTAEQAYLSLLGKFTAAALLLAEMGLPATLTTAMAYLAGAFLALGLTLLQQWLLPSDATEWSPSDEWHHILAGDTNGPLFGFTLPITILLAMLSAQWLHAEHAAWVGLTVLFVMHVNDASTWIKVRQRILGTLLGVGITYLIIIGLPSNALVALVMLLAIIMPTCLRQSYAAFSCVITIIVLVIVDLAMLNQGGDEYLIRWRLFDTLIGCAWVALSLILLRLGKAWWPKKIKP
ncbi:FUSC family protein [Shewanella sp. SNU WT4]|uniref:FUSC family protein n=1 Tax=Shewanella sp. SNU WT4 TaxID=2590015 RepID=UPI001F103140|nr:FUSC family protein [Shewanella sp. SNU WT4]